MEIEQTRIVNSVDAETLYRKVEDDKNVRLQKYDYPLDNHYTVCDLQLEVRGQQEDTLYAEDEFLRKNIRRGNTIISSEKSGFFWARKGLQKFFDLQREYLTHENATSSKFNQKKYGANCEDSLRRVILGEVENSIQHSDKENSAQVSAQPQTQILLYKMNKANGENAQVSYVAQLNSWAIASKNVCLIARNFGEVDQYYPESKQRFNFARHIAKQWFQLLQSLGTEREQSLQKQLTGRTAIGEYCGNSNYQHLVRYESVQILFYAIVQHDLEDTCISPSEAMEIFQKHNLKTVKCEQKAAFQDLEALRKCLLEIYDKSASADIDSEEEGSVLYFVRQQTEKSGQITRKTLSLCKIKTLEYRIYRKLREKLRNFLKNRQSNPSSFTQKFQREVKQLCEHNQPFRSLNHYQHVAEKAFEFAKQYSNQLSEVIGERYIDFLSALLYCLERGEELKPQYLSLDSEVLKSAVKIKFSEYQQFNRTKIASTHRIIVVVPISIPGIGKSTFVKSLERIIAEDSSKRCGKGAKLFTISSDIIRQECINSILKKQPRLSHDEAFGKTFKDSKFKFQKDLEDILKRECTKQETSIVFIDKNHPPQAIFPTLEMLQRQVPDKAEFRIVALLPEQKNPSTLLINKIGAREERLEYPFSLSTIINCLQRVQERKTHETMRGDSVKLLGICLMFVNMFRGADLSDKQLKESGFDAVMRIPLVKEADESKFPEKFTTKLAECLGKAEVGGECKDREALQELDKLFQAQKFKFENTTEKEMLDRIYEEYRKLIDDGSVGDDIEPVGSQKEESFKPQQDAQANKKSHTTFNPSKVPLYLGVFARDTKKFDEQADCFLVHCLDLLKEKFAESEQAVARTLEQINSKKVFRKPPGDLHITSYFVAGKTDSPFYQNFREGVSVEMEVVAVVVVPDKIITGVCFPKGVDVENKCPHITLRVGAWPAVKSNLILNVLFSQTDSPLKEIYQRGFFSERESVYIERISVALEGERGSKQIAYVIKPKSTLCGEGVTKACYM